MKKTIILNWKHNFPENWKDYLNLLIKIQNHANYSVVLAPPAPFLQHIKEVFCDIPLACQDASLCLLGPQTGSLGIELVSKLNYEHLILGHVEHLKKGLTKEDLLRKIQAAYFYGITPIVCINERYLEDSAWFLNDLICLQPEHREAFYAYEPTTSVGGSITSMDDILQTYERVQHICSKEKKPFRFFYGGGCTIESASILLQKPFISGLLLGRMSLELNLVAGLLEC